MKLSIYFLSLILTSGLFAQSDKKLNKLFIEINKINKSYSVENPIWQGKHPEEYLFLEVKAKIEAADRLRGKLEYLKSIPDDKLSGQGRINKAIKILQLENQISEVDFKTYLIPFNSEGGFYNSPSFFLPNLSFRTVEDYENYLGWLPSFSNYLTYNKDLLEMGIEEGILAPKVIVRNNLKLLSSWTELNTIPFYSPIRSMPDVFSKEDQARIKAKAENIILNQIIPSYLSLEQFLRSVYLEAAPEKVGISEIKDGSTYYENRIRHFTTLNITPDSVFQIGQTEVARIKKSMQSIIAELAFHGDFAEFLKFLRTDPQFYPNSAQELLNKAAWLSKKAEGQLPKLFSKLYELPFTVAPVPDDIAPNYTGGRYVGGNKAQGRPGTYWVNTYNLKSRTYYTLPALTLHEAVPGHHLQITLASELTNLPSFRKSYYISAFGEGWGLYSEYLGEEMGMYETPYDLFGRYTYEMWRACRLVVDVGLHYKGWTREQAVQFMAESTALSLHEVNTEIDRYIGWPGQAVSYKIGELMIKYLRAECENELGEDFDIREFHDVILRNGSIPLPMLEKEVRDYLQNKKNS